VRALFVDAASLVFGRQSCEWGINPKVSYVVDELIQLCEHWQ